MITVPGVDFEADGVVVGDSVQFITAQERLGDPSNTLSVEPQLFQVTIVAGDTLTVTGTFPVQTDVEMRVIRAGNAKAAVAALDAICALLDGGSAGIIAFLWSEQIIDLANTFDRDVNAVLVIKQEFELAFENTLTANFVQPIKRTFASASATLTTEIEKLSAVLDVPTFNKFTAMGLSFNLCNLAGVISESFKRTPEGVKNEIQAEINFDVFDTATVDIASIGNEPAEEFSEFVVKYRQTAQAILVVDIRPTLADRTAELLVKITAVQVWLLAQQVIVTVLPVVANLAAKGAVALTEASGLDRLDSLLKCSNLTDFAKSSANAGTKAGKAAEELGACIEDLPVSEAEKKNALTRVRDEMLAFERTQILTAEAILEETPSSIGDVDGQTLQALKIQKQVEVLLA